jgi:hypothetical protein
MTMALVGSMLTLLLTLLPARAASWPDWQLPAPLQPSGRSDLVYPAWFAGSWQLSSHDLAGQEPDLQHPVRFVDQGGGVVVGDRAFNANAVGAALLGAQLLAVENDPANPNRQLARLAGGVLLESTVVARRSEPSGTGSGGDRFSADELALQVVRGPGGEPRISQVETLSRYRLEADGTISGEQWQATYPSPGAGLIARPLRTAHWQLRLEPPTTN